MIAALSFLTACILLRCFRNYILKENMKSKHHMVQLHEAIQKSIKITMDGMGKPELEDVKNTETLKELLIYQTAYHHLTVIRKTIEIQATL